MSPTFLAEFKGALQVFCLVLPLFPKTFYWLITSLYARAACTHHCRLCMIVRIWYWSNPFCFFMLQIGQRTDNVSTLPFKACNCKDRLQMSPTLNRPGGVAHQMQGQVKESQLFFQFPEQEDVCWCEVRGVGEIGISLAVIHKVLTYKEYRAVSGVF